MKPWTSFYDVAKWVLRIAILMVVFTKFYDTFMDFELNAFEFYISAVYVVFGVLLFIGGFLSKPNLTVISGLLLLLPSIYMAVKSFDGITETFALNVLLGGVALFFFTVGNK